MSTDIQSGDAVMCMNSEGLEEYGVEKTCVYSVASVHIIPGQGEYVGVFVPSKEDKNKGQVVLADADRFEKAHTLQYRVWLESGSYVLLNAEGDITAEEEESGESFDLTLTLPESEFDNVEDAIKFALGKVLEKRDAGAANDDSPD